MLMEEVTFVETAFKILCAGFAGLASWLWAGMVGDMRSVKKEITDMSMSFRKEVSEITKDHADHRIYVEREFEKKETTQLSLARIHDRLDQLFKLLANNRDTRE